MLYIAGGTGFIGRHLAESLGEFGCRARCLARSTEKADSLRRQGFEAVAGDITDRESLRGTLGGCAIAVHLVGIIKETGSATFEKVHVEGTANLVEEAKRAGVGHFFYQSALGASPASRSRYLKTKAEAEEIVKAGGIPYTIFRPSLIVGSGDGFTESLRELVDIGPFVPVPGDGNAKFQPMYVKDWVKCFMALFCPSRDEPDGRHPGESRTYEIGGPERLTYNEILSQFMKSAGISKPVQHIPVGMIRLGLPFSGIAKVIGGMLGKNIPLVTSGQLDLLQSDNTCDEASVEKGFGFAPITYAEALKLF